jgi:collagen type IV alpha-3-binding protein
VISRLVLLFCFVVQGITGHELCHYFWDPAVRLEWEVTLDTSTVLSWLSHDTHVTYQVLKRVWPTAQRDSIFWSTIRHCPSDDDDGPDYWIVVNYSTDSAVAPAVGACSLDYKFCSCDPRKIIVYALMIKLT